MRLPLLPSACLAVSLAAADDSLLTPCYGPGAGELFTETALTRAWVRTATARDYSLELWQGVYYGLSDSWTLCAGAAESRERYAPFAPADPEDDEAEWRAHSRTRGTFLGLWYSHDLDDADSLEAEVYYTMERTAREHPQELLSLSSYYCHDFGGALGLVRLAMDTPVSAGRGNDPAFRAGLCAYTRLAESAGLQLELFAEHCTATGNRAAAFASAAVGYQFNDHIALRLGVTAQLHDSGRTHRGEPYERTRRSTSLDICLRVLF